MDQNNKQSKFKTLNKESQNEEDIDSNNSEEEKDNYAVNENKNFFIPQIPTKEYNKSKETPKNVEKKFKGEEWSDYFDYKETIQGMSVYVIDRENKIDNERSNESNRPLFLCLHGAGMCGTSFGQLSVHLRKWSNIVAFDWRGHGNSMELECNLDVLILSEDVMRVVEYIVSSFKESNVIIVGHSMGGSLAVKSLNFILENAGHNIINRLMAIIVIDVVEGTAMDALPFMEQIIQARPKSFPSIEQAVEWTVKSKTIRNLKSAKTSVPLQFLYSPIQQTYNWRVDLLKTKKYWNQWFKGLTQQFLNIKLPKLLLLAEKERMDKELTIANMQGKFRLNVLHNVGHSLHEDDPLNTAKSFHQMCSAFRIPVSHTDSQLLIKQGVGKFTPNLQPFSN